MKRENWKGWGWSYTHGMPMVFINIQRVIVIGLFLMLIKSALFEVWVPGIRWIFHELIK